MRRVNIKSNLIEASIILSKFLPRGKGALPRLAGQLILGDDLYERRAPAGFIMHWDRHSLDMLSHLTNSGGWDQHVLNALKSLTKPDSVFYDIGSNIGFMALSIATARPGVRTYAFEPLPDLASALTSSALANGAGNLTVSNVALSNATGETSFFLPRHSIHASLVAREAGSTELKVQTMRLDDLDLPPPDVIKIDVEGAEMMVIEGGRKLLRDHVPHIVYECDGNTDRFPHTPSDMVRELASLGYDRFYRIYGDARAEVGVGDGALPFGDYVAICSRRLAYW